MIRALCPICGILGWLAPPADTHPAVRARIIAEGGRGRIHQCSLTAIARMTTRELPTADALDDLVAIGRTLPVWEVVRR